MNKMQVAHKKDPFVRMIKRDTIHPVKAVMIRLFAALLSLIVCAFIIFLITKQQPLEIYAGIVDGAIETHRRIFTTIREAVILLLIAVALVPAFKMRFWNIGAEGQILMGAAATSAVMIYFGNQLDNTILLIIIMGILLTFIQKAIGQGIAILFGASGEILTEKSGNLNLGVPGIMYMGGIAGLMGAFLYENQVKHPNAFIGMLLALLCTILASMLGGFILLWNILEELGLIMDLVTGVGLLSH